MYVRDEGKNLKYVTDKISNMDINMLSAKIWRLNWEYQSGLTSTNLWDYINYIFWTVDSNGATKPLTFSQGRVGDDDFLIYTIIDKNTSRKTLTWYSTVLLWNDEEGTDFTINFTSNQMLVVLTYRFMNW